MKHLLTVLLGTFLFICANAAPNESGRITGRIIGEDKKPMEFVVVTLLKAEDSSLVKGSITDVDGKYAFENLTPGNFLVSASYTGFTKVMQGPYAIAADQNFAM